jgi:hypothetical protein
LVGCAEMIWLLRELAERPPPKALREKLEEEP